MTFTQILVLMLYSLVTCSTCPNPSAPQPEAPNVIAPAAEKQVCQSAPVAEATTGQSSRAGQAPVVNEKAARKRCSQFVAVTVRGGVISRSLAPQRSTSCGCPFDPS